MFQFNGIPLLLVSGAVFAGVAISNGVIYRSYNKLIGLKETTMKNYPSASVCYNIANIHTFSLYPEQFEKLKANSRTSGASMSAILRDLIENHLVDYSEPDDEALVA